MGLLDDAKGLAEGAVDKAKDLVDSVGGGDKAKEAVDGATDKIDEATGGKASAVTDKVDDAAGAAIDGLSNS
jgi:hypothetical protein